MKAITALALAGLAPTAAAQFAINLTASGTGGFVGSTITWTVSVTGSFGGIDYVQGYDFNIVGIGIGFSVTGAFQDNLSPLVGPTAGTPSGQDLLGASGGQSSILGATVAGPIVLGTFETTIDSNAFDISFTIEDGGKLALTDVLQIKPGSDFAPDTWNGVPTINSDRVISPAPSSALALTLLTLGSHRRRR
ncbi:MAG: hypothetical protein R3B49_11030 [Phycisphaerales bacterium]